MKGSLAEAWMEEGVEKGISQGITQGISQTKIKVAKNMLSDGDSMDKISRITGLTRSEIKKLASQN